MGSAKIIVSLDGEFLREVVLSDERTTIGRRPYNDIVLDNAAISGEHAMIATVLNESILEDLNSTNGTYVNGQPVKKHFLQNNDIIELLKYRLQYIDAEHADLPVASNVDDDRAPVLPTEPASLQVLNGSNAGHSVTLAKEVTTLGRAGAQVVAISRLPEGYVIASIEGPAPQVNGKPVGTKAFPLIDGDVIDLSGTQIKFSWL